MDKSTRSLEPLEGIVSAELGHQHRHFDSLDTKAGIVLGFGGAIVALIADAVSTYQSVALVLSVIAISVGGLSALVALSSFWPREFQVLKVSKIRDDALGRLPDESLRVALLDTNIATLDANRDLLHTKAFRLKVSVSLLLVAVGLLGAGMLTDAL